MVITRLRHTLDVFPSLGEENAPCDVCSFAVSARPGDDGSLVPAYVSNRLAESRLRSYRRVSGNGGNQDSRRIVQSS